MQDAPVNSEARLAWGLTYEKRPVDLFTRCENTLRTKQR